MERRNIDDLIDIIRKSVEQHKLATGQYSRWIFGENRDLSINEYGCADAANILYSIGDFPTDIDERAQWVKILQNMQDKETGMFNEKTHHPFHTTAHCSAALELFDAKPLYKCSALEKYTTKEGLYSLFEEEIDWKNPWDASHMGAGILPALVNTNMATLEWKDWYFDWMWEHSDEKTGFISLGGCKENIPIYGYMAGHFHYLFNHETEHRPMRYPEKVIDSCLALMKLGQSPLNAGMRSFIGFIDIDVVYCLTRAMRQTPHRFYEAKAELEYYADNYLNMFYGIDYEHDKYFNDLHSLFGAVCCLCELQSALPGKIITSKPLKLVLDRRPFI